MDNNFLLYVLLFFVLIWFILIAPQRRKEKERQRLLDSLEVGDRVVTIGGLYGYITAIGEENLQLEVADGVLIEIMRNAVALVKNEEEEDEDEGEEDEDAADNDSNSKPH